MRPAGDFGRREHAALVLLADESRDRGRVAERVGRDPPVDLRHAVAILVGKIRETAEPRRELDLHPDLDRAAGAGRVQIGLGGRLAHDLRPARQAPALRTDARHHVFQPIGAGHVLPDSSSTSGGNAIGCARSSAESGV